MERFIDLHVHTTHSDGSFSPHEVVRNAKRLGFAAIGIVDHDEVGGINEATWFGNAESLEIVPGVEITTGFNGKEIHILGYLMDCNDRPLRKKLQEARYNRFKRMQKMVDRLGELGMKIRPEAVRKLAGHGSIGRLHLARALFEEKIVGTVQEAFDLYIGKGKPAYVKKPRMKASTAIELIRAAGGVPVLAHPKLAHIDDKIHELVDIGLKGIEAYYAKNTPEETEKYLAIAAEFDLRVTGGSDCHGMIKDKMLLGTVKVPYRYLDELRACARSATEVR